MLHDKKVSIIDPMISFGELSNTSSCDPPKKSWSGAPLPYLVFDHWK